jgi:hypothetical protein
LDLTVLIGGVEDLAATQWEKSMWLGKRGDKREVRKGGEKEYLVTTLIGRKFFSDCVKRQKTIPRSRGLKTS